MRVTITSGVQVTTKQRTVRAETSCDAMLQAAARRLQKITGCRAERTHGVGVRRGKNRGERKRRASCERGIGEKYRERTRGGEGKKSNIGQRDLRRIHNNEQRNKLSPNYANSRPGGCGRSLVTSAWP